MNELDSLNQATKALESILGSLGVNRVVFVDDYSNGNVTVDDVIAAAIGLNEEFLIRVIPELGNISLADPDVLSARLHDVWGELNADQKKQRTKEIFIAASRKDGDQANDVISISILNGLVPPEILISLTPTEWRDQKAHLLQESKDHRTLFLFDRDFGNDEGDENSGIRIIAALLSSVEHENTICGLLTQTVRPETQEQQWEELSDEYNIRKDRFALIPKLHISQSPMMFAKLLKFAVLSPEYEMFKRDALDLLEDATAVARDRVNALRIHDFDHIVFDRPADEGLWEPDMLFRLYALFHRRESRRLAFEQGALEAIAGRLRTGRGIPTKCEHFQPQNAWALQQEEYYESEPHINRYHLPIEVGDIFERVGANTTKRYMLLAQPCDLMVRGDGKRSPELCYVPLVEVVRRDGKSPTFEKMPYYGSSPSDVWSVRMKPVHLVSVCILDLCTFNQDGVARLELEGDVPTGSCPAWRNRHSHLQKHFRSMTGKTDILAAHGNDAHAVQNWKAQNSQGLRNVFLGDGFFKGRLSDNGEHRTVLFDCKRVRRLTRSRAMGLLMSYTASLSRPAYDLEYG